ncbi:MAG: hypothetical protein E6Q88_06245 [Lysobacteraceae bacterium]|nr:MAG: hypothetical protein E6Q88_06245 [Xanthomonadaceae bacterium]
MKRQDALRRCGRVLFRASFAAGLAATLAGCVDIHEIQYPPVSVALDDKNELLITTYPSWFPRETSGIPFLKKTVRTPDSIFFQVYVKDPNQEAGPNPNVSSIRIESFSYRQDGRPPVVLIKDYDANFWMQDNPNYNTGARTPVPCVPNQSITIAMSLVLNGKRHTLQRRITAVERSQTALLPWYVLSQ